MAKAQPLKIPPPEEMPYHMRPKEFDPTAGGTDPAGGKGAKQLAETPLRTLLAQRRPDQEHTPTEQTREGVMYAAAFDVAHRHIAMIAGVSEEQLREIYAEELEIGKPLLVNDLETGLYNIAVDRFHKDSMKASVKLLEWHGGTIYRPVNRTEITGANGGALQIQQDRTIDPTLLSPDQRDALRELIMAGMRLAGSEAAPALAAQPVLEGRFAPAPSVEDLLR